MTITVYNEIELAAVNALLRAMRAHRAAAPEANYRTDFKVSINNAVKATYQLSITEPISQTKPR